MNIKRNSRYKSRGSILVITALAAIVWIFIAQSLFIVGAGGFGMIKGSMQNFVGFWISHIQRTA